MTDAVQPSRRGLFGWLFAAPLAASLAIDGAIADGTVCTDGEFTTVSPLRCRVVYEAHWSDWRGIYGTPGL